MERATPRVLAVDDDVHLLAALRRGLVLLGFEVVDAREASTALDCVESGWPDVMVLDIMMPGLDGLHLCRLVREKSPALPILMLTALDSVPDRVAGLEAGADDYLVKPFALDELVARVRALLRRARSPRVEQGQLSYSDLTMNTATWSAARAGEPVTLTATEFRLLELLIRSPGKVFTREDILASVWGESPPIESNVVDAHVANIRQKTEAGGRPRLIQTVRGVGYVLKEG
ncbi:MAG TPA: response regulator transcription factor [Dehalococcoidia bacterium]|nr:response regulator transcription factor [Dehalococcoidia bacterium]